MMNEWIERTKRNAREQMVDGVEMRDLYVCMLVSIGNFIVI